MQPEARVQGLRLGGLHKQGRRMGAIEPLPHLGEEEARWASRHRHPRNEQEGQVRE